MRDILSKTVLQLQERTILEALKNKWWKDKSENFILLLENVEEFKVAIFALTTSKVRRRRLHRIFSVSSIFRENMYYPRNIILIKSDRIDNVPSQID